MTKPVKGLVREGVAYAGAAQTPRRQHHDDLHPRPEPRTRRRAEPGGPDVCAVTWPAASHGISSGIGREASQPIPMWEDRSVQAQPAESKGQHLAAMGSVAIGIGCRTSHELPCYTGQPIPPPNLSYTPAIAYEYSS